MLIRGCAAFTVQPNLPEIAAKHSNSSRTVIFAATARGIGGFSRLHVLRVRIDPVAYVVLVVMPDPSHPMLQALFVAPLGRDVQPVVRADENVQPARVTRIGMEDIASRILVEHARAGPFLARELLHGIV